MRERKREEKLENQRGPKLTYSACRKGFANLPIMMCEMGILLDLKLFYAITMIVHK